MLKKWANVQTTNENSEGINFSPEVLYLVYGDFFNCCRWQLKTSTENAELRKQVQYLYLGQESRLDDKDYLKLKPCMTVSKHDITWEGEKCCLKGGCRADRTRLFSVVPTDRNRGSGHKLKHGRLPLNTRKCFILLGWLSTGKGCQGCCSISILRDSQNQPDYNPGQPAVHGPAWPWCVGPDDLWRSLQPQRLCDFYGCIKVRY